MPIVLYTAVFCAVTQCSLLVGRNLRDVPKSSCQGDYLAQYPRKSLVLTPFGLKGMERAITQASAPTSSGFGWTVNEIWPGNFCSRTTHKSVPFTYKWPQKPETGTKQLFSVKKSDTNLPFGTFCLGKKDYLFDVQLLWEGSRNVNFQKLFVNGKPARTSAVKLVLCGDDINCSFQCVNIFSLIFRLAQ